MLIPLYIREFFHNRFGITLLYALIMFKFTYVLYLQRKYIDIESVDAFASLVDMAGFTFSFAGATVVAKTLRGIYQFEIESILSDYVSRTTKSK